MTPENEAEERVLEAFESREGEVNVRGVGGGFLRAGFLRDLYLGRLGNGKDWEPRRVMIAGANVAERLELDYCEVRHPLFFNDCCFPEGISLLGSTIPALSLENCRLRGSVKVFGDLNDHAALNANRLRSGYVHLVSGSVAGLVSFFDANIDGLLACVGGTFECDLVAGNLRAREIWMSMKFKVNGDVNLGGADISGDLVCNQDCEFRGDILAQDLKAREVIMRKPFTAKGNVSLDGAAIRGQLVCSGGIFESGVGAEGLQAEQVYFNDGFKSKGGVILTEAVINGQLNCRAGTFEGSRIVHEQETGSFAASGLRAGNVFLDKGFTAECGVNIVGALIRDRLSCGGGEFQSGLSLTDAEVKTFESDQKSWPKKGSLILDGFHYRRLKGGAGDSAEAGLEWLSRMGDDFRPQPYEQLMSVYRRMGCHDWAREVGFELEKRRHRGFKKSNKFLARIWKFMKPFWKWLDRFWWNRWSAILNLTIGYGYKPFRSLAWAVCLWLAGALAFGSANLSDCGRSPSWNEIPALFLGVENRSECSVDLVRPSDGSVLAMLAARKSIPEKYPRFVPVVYSAEALFPVFEFGQLGKWHLGNIWLSVLRWVMTAGGTGLLAILALFGVGALGPQRWRGGEGG